MEPRRCRIEGCRNLEKIQWHEARPHHGAGWRHAGLCHAHRRRKVLYGSPTARKCRVCHQVVDDVVRDETHLLGGYFVCMACLIEKA